MTSSIKAGFDNYFSSSGFSASKDVFSAALNSALPKALTGGLVEVPLILYLLGAVGVTGIGMNAYNTMPADLKNQLNQSVANLANHISQAPAALGAVLRDEYGAGDLGVLLTRP